MFIAPSLFKSYAALYFSVPRVAPKAVAKSITSTMFTIPSLLRSPLIDGLGFVGVAVAVDVAVGLGCE